MSVSEMLLSLLARWTSATDASQTTSPLLTKIALVSAVDQLIRVGSVSRRHTCTTWQRRRLSGLTCKLFLTISHPRLILTFARLTIHNVHFLLNLMGAARQAILEDRYPAFVRQFFSDIYDGDKSKYPQWAVGALRGVGMDLLADS